jgi:hypothetical protein
MDPQAQLARTQVSLVEIGPSFVTSYFGKQSAILFRINFSCNQLAATILL